MTKFKYTDVWGNDVELEQRYKVVTRKYKYKLDSKVMDALIKGISVEDLFSDQLDEDMSKDKEDMELHTSIWHDSMPTWVHGTVERKNEFTNPYVVIPVEVGILENEDYAIERYYDDYGMSVLYAEVRVHKLTEKMIQAEYCAELYAHAEKSTKFRVKIEEAEIRKENAEEALAKQAEKLSHMKRKKSND